MEDYDKFAQRCFSRLRKSEEGEEEEEDSRPSPASSLIRVYGRPILPPLLSAGRREEMRRHRDAAQEAAGRRRLKRDPRMALVQTILQSVQMRKTPTLEELLQEPGINSKSVLSHNTSDGSVSESDFLSGTKGSTPLSPSPASEEEDGFSLSPVTPTMYSAFPTSGVTPQLRYQEGCLNDQHDSQRGPQLSSLNGATHQSLSSGYKTQENVQNTISGSSEEAHTVAGVFLHSASNTIAKMPEIISHPPIDGEELERSGLESPFCNDFMAVRDICRASFQDDSVACDRLAAERADGSYLDSAEGGGSPHPPAVLDLSGDRVSDRGEDPSASSENSGFSDNPELSETLSTSGDPGERMPSQRQSAEAEDADSGADGANPTEEPYRLSLQALLKKSQEYRRRQRLLRNQAKNAKVQERTREQPRASAEEQSLSDKENDESICKGTATAERRGKKSWENERLIESEFTGKKADVESDSRYLTVRGSAGETTRVEREATLNELNRSQEVVTEREQIAAFVRPVSTETPAAREAFYVTGEQRNTCPDGVFTGSGKYRTIPAPNLCTSPVHFKSRGGVGNEEPADGAETSEDEVWVGAGLMEDHGVGEGSAPGRRSVPAVNPMVQGDVTNVLAKSSEHIDQLESNLSCLKVLISDLESTVKENMEGSSQTASGWNDPHAQLLPSDGDRWEDELRDDDVDSTDSEYRELPRRESFDGGRLEDAGPGPVAGGTDDAPVMARGEAKQEANGRESRGVVKEGLARSSGQPPGKCLLSVAQRMLVPDAFRNASVLSDASNHPAERRNEAAAGGRGPARPPPLNRSYDVDAPSGLWLPGGSGSDPGSGGPLVREKDLTPESGGEGQGGVSRVKRRLLMHAAEGSRERGVELGPSCSTPRAAARRREGRESEQERLKRAHAAQVRALQEEHRRQQEELLQALSARYHLLQSVSFPCSASTSRPGDTPTSPALSQPSGPPPERRRPLLAAAARGFLTRRLLRTERVAQLVRTVKDTQHFLHALRQQNPSRGELRSRQDLLLQERVALQLRAARYEVHDVFFGLSAGERMQLIGRDRELARERELRRQSGHAGRPGGKSSLSAATQKSLERKRGMMIQKKAAERHRGAATRTGRRTGISAEQTLETKRGQFRANPRRVPKNTYSTRPR